jgi:hypothetical protein
LYLPRSPRLVKSTRAYFFIEINKLEAAGVITLNRFTTHGSPYFGGLKLSVVIFSFLVGFHAAYAHGWYPATCCLGKDCGVVLKKIKASYGTWIFTERGKAFFPDGWTIMPSMDENEHACMVEIPAATSPGGDPVMAARCWFQPGLS